MEITDVVRWRDIVDNRIRLVLVQEGMQVQRPLADIRRQRARRDDAGLLESDTDITGVLSKEEIERTFDLNEQFKHIDHIFDRVFHPVRA